MRLTFDLADCNGALQRREVRSVAARLTRRGAIAQLGERSAGSRKVVGSSPTSSISRGSALGLQDFRQGLGRYMDRAAAGESFLITRRGKRYARLAPP